MRRRVLSLVACLSLLGASAWLVANPVAAVGEAKIQCADGSTRTCSGTHCEGTDDTGAERGYCLCSSGNQSVDQKYCPVREGIGMVEGGS